MSALDPRVVEPVARFDVQLALPTSKSITNRALLLAALSNGPGRVVDALESDDCDAFIAALNAMGAECSWDGADVVVHRPLPSGQEANVDCRDAGTAARFLPPAAVALGDSVTFDASEQMRARPMADLFTVLRELGATTEPAAGDHLPLLVCAEGLAGGVVELAGNVSSQFLSGLLMAAPLAGAPLTIACRDLISRPYIDLTISMMEEFGGSVTRDGYDRFDVAPTGRYRRAEPYVVEADASTASYFFALAAATGSRVQVTNLRRSSRQGDVVFVNALALMGATVVDGPGGIMVQGPERLRGITLDMGDISDVMMTLACIAPLADSPVRITNVGQARVKESDRIDAVVAGLTRLGITVASGPDWLEVHPGIPQPAVIDPRNDHRIAMSFAVLGMASTGLTIEDPGCVAKTCPTFFEICDAIAASAGTAP